MEVSTNFGVGFEITNQKELKNYSEYGILETLKHIFKDYAVFATGSYYTRDALTYNIVLNSPESVSSIEERANKLKELLIVRNLVDKDAEFNIVGGELWW